ncbi:MAG: GAF domain-containing protein [Bacillota bacterium]|nr:GAF domain-containing protein [Bacillota bacterium]
MEQGSTAFALGKIAKQSDLNAAMEATVDAVVSLLAPDHAGLYLQDWGSGRLVLAARNTSLDPAIQLGLKLRANEGPIGQAFASCRARCDSYDFRGDAVPPQGVSPTTRSHLVQPLMDGETPVGVLEAQAGRPGAFDSSAAATLALVSRNAARSLRFALGVRQEAVRSRLVGSLLDAAVTGAVFVDREGWVRHASGRLLAMLGLESNGRGGPTGRTYRRFFWPRLAARLDRPSRYPPAKVARAVIEGRELEEDMCLSGPVEMTIRRRCVPVRDDEGRIAGRIEIYEDVTAERRAARRLEASASIARALTASFDLTSIFAGLTHGLSAAVEFDAAICYIRGVGGAVRIARLDPRFPDSPVLEETDRPAAPGGCCCPEGSALVTSDLLAEGPLRGPAAELRALGMKQVCVLPLAVGETRCGIMAVGLARPVPRYSQATLDTLVPLAEFLSLAVNNAVLFEEATSSGEAAREEAVWASALLDMARAVASSPGPHETCAAGADVLRRLFDHRWALIALRDSSRDVYVVGHADFERYSAPCREFDLSPAIAVLIEAASAGARVLTVTGPEVGPDLPPGTASLAVAPLCSADDLIGGVILGFAHGRGLAGEREQAILLGLADQMALGVQQAGLLAAAKQQASLLAGISRASRRLTSSLDLETVLDEVIGFLTRDQGADWVGIYLKDKGTGDLMLRAHGGRFAPLVAPGERIPLGRGLIGAAAGDGQPVIANDVSVDSRFVGAPGNPTQAEMCVPLKFNDQILGVLNVESARRNAFGDRELQVVETLSDHLAIAINNADLYQHIRRLHLATTQSLVRAMEARDPYARGHGARVSEYAVAIGCRLGLNTPDVEELRLAGLLHDVGKVVVEDRVLAKRGPLDSVERALVMEHSVAGAGILRRTEALAALAPLVRWHHEWYGGGGYPDGIKDDDIPVGSRILAVADAFDAMTSDRPYRTALPIDEAEERLRAGQYTQFDPAAAQAFLAVLAEARQCGSPLWRDLQQRVEASREAGGMPVAGRGSPDQPGRILPVHGRALNVMYRVSLETGSILQRQQLLQRILGILHDTMGKHKYVILLAEPDSNDLLIEAEIGFGSSHHRYRIPAGRGVTGWVAEQGVPLLVKDVENDPRYIAGPSSGIRSELAVPLIARGRVIGVLDIESEVPNAFTTEDLYLISAVAGQISTAIEVSQQHEQVARAAIVDGLTGLYNHSYFYRRLEEEMARSKRHGRPLVVGIADVDKLKEVNDEYGHLAGDAVLREIAACLRAMLRKSDIVARYGGDEFGLIMPDTDLPDAGMISQRFQAELHSRLIKTDKHEITLPTLALGLAVFPLEGDSPDALVSKADERLYVQKGSGRSSGPSHLELRVTRTA